jgi:biotin synthase
VAFARERESDDHMMRNDWTREEISDLFDLPFLDLVARARDVHKQHHPENEVQRSTLLSIKTGGCAEDCGFCNQSAHAQTGLKATKLMEVQQVLQAAAQAKDHGSTRFCMGAAWRNPKDKDIPKLAAMVEGVRAMGMETCMTLGMLTPHQARSLAGGHRDHPSVRFNPDSGELPETA